MAASVPIAARVTITTVVAVRVPVIVDQIHPPLVNMRSRLVVFLVVGLLVIGGAVSAWFFLMRAQASRTGEPGTVTRGTNEEAQSAPSEGSPSAPTSPAQANLVQAEQSEARVTIREAQQPCFPDCYPGYSDDENVPLAELLPGDPAYDAAAAAQRQAEQERQSAQGAIIPDTTSGAGGATVIPILDGNADPDNDGLTNDQELQLGSDRNTSDTDNDSLPDGEEARTHRTDPKRSDTDGDGLRDGEEVRTYRTDPLNPDTDGDHYTDGTEVKGGYNPNGTGKL
jgi:hypothetical protein